METTSANGNNSSSKNSKDSNILIVINGDEKFIPKDISILELLNTYKINKDRVVIELNKNIISKNDFEKTVLRNKDLVEIVTFVGGG